MSYRRTVHYHEVDDTHSVGIIVAGEIDLDILESIEGFCHRQRFRIAKEIQARLEQPVPAVSETCDETQKG
jgi:hypothetical protein